jgi:hypothetical protein
MLYLLIQSMLKVVVHHVESKQFQAESTRRRNSSPHYSRPIANEGALTLASELRLALEEKKVVPEQLTKTEFQNVTIYA